ncbi:DUF1905 domain-containing protein [Leifsonia sp. YAF41]|uniref:DUF1905 domain-containing protein n=1 Tax=Leifsonia sp. YAF41 TaxID=3233086 RepID=UPI003F9B30CE
MESFDIEAVLWEPAAENNSWVFVTVPVPISQEIKDRPRPPAPGFGSIRVRVTIGRSTWATSLFPDATRGCYLLPVKKQIRVAESIAPGDQIGVHLEVLQ